MLWKLGIKLIQLVLLVLFLLGIITRDSSSTAADSNNSFLPFPKMMELLRELGMLIVLLLLLVQMLLKMLLVMENNPLLI